MVYEHISFKFCINLHTDVIHLCPYLLILHALDYVWSLIMYFSVCLWPWLPVNYLPVLSLGNDAPAEEKLLRSQHVEGCSHWEASIIKLDWNPALAGGWLAGWDRSFSKGCCCMKCLMLVTILSILVNLMVDFCTSSHLWLFRSHAAAQTSTDGIKLQDEGVYIVLFFA